eukprot:m.46041 g.46041  ORF g.46041 m.46041 type:complete len:517 (-) comp20128_c0_seq1:363-1913(-)
MFGDAAGCGVSVDPTWSTTKESTACGTQTSETLYVNTGANTTYKLDAGTQTDEPDEAEIGDAIKILDVNALNAFLTAAEKDLIVPTIERNNKTHAFDGYSPLWEDEVKDVTCVKTLSQTSPTRADLYCTGVSWNCTGSVIYVAYGKFDEETWCSHVCTWNIDRQTLQEDKADSVVEMPSSVLSIACHPEQPSIVVCGTFHGKVMVIDSARPSGQELVAVSDSTSESHSEPVMKVEWLTQQDARRKKQFSIISIAGDGKILIWNIVKAASGKSGLKSESASVKPTSELQLTARMIVTGGDLRLSQKLQHVNRKTQSEVGLTCISFSNEDKSRFAVGTETGAVLGCSLTPGSVSAAPADLPVGTPVVMGYEAHSGPVYAVGFSPFHRNLFLSASTDGSIQIYNLLQATPVHSLVPSAGYLFDVAWSPSRPMVFAAASEIGTVVIYDLHNSMVTPCVTLEASSKTQPVYAIAFNPKKPRLLASGDASGKVKIWSLSNDLMLQGASELVDLNNIADSLGE